MKFYRFISKPPVSPYAPQWDFRVGTSLCEDIDTNSLSEFLLSKEKEVKKLPTSVDNSGVETDGYTGLGSNSTTAKFQHYNILTWSHPEITKLRSNIAKKLLKYNSECGVKSPNVIYIICWYNVLRFGQKIKPHLHCTDENAYLSAHFTIQCDDTSTMYMNPVNQLNDPYIIERKNKPGNFTIFPEYIPHFTTKHLSDVPRITMAMDIRTIQPDGDNWIKL